MTRALPRAPNLVPMGARVVVATPVPGGEVKVGHTGSVAAGLKRANLAVRWDSDGKLRRVHRKRLLYTEEVMAEKNPEFVELDVTTNAAVALPLGTVVLPDRECAVRLPTGQVLKFWVCAELVDDANDQYRDLSHAELHALGVHLEALGGTLQER